MSEVHQVWRKLLQAHDRERRAVHRRDTYEEVYERLASDDRPVPPSLWDATVRHLEDRRAAVEAARVVLDAAIDEVHEFYTTLRAGGTDGGSNG